MKTSNELSYEDFLKLLRKFARTRLKRPYFTREELLSYIIYTGYDISYYKITKLLKRACKEGILREDKKKDVQKSYAWGLPIYRRVYVLKKLP